MNLNHACKLSLLVGAVYLLPFEASGQEHRSSDFTINAGTSFPLQHMLQFGWIFTKGPVFEAYAQLGLPPREYIRPLVEVSVTENETAKEYLKQHLTGRIGYGAGIRWHFSRYFNVDIAYSKLNYVIDKESSKELIDALVYDGQALKEILSDMAARNTLFNNLYSNYLITSIAHAHQISVSGGYQFALNKRKSVFVVTAIGASATIQTTARIDSNHSSQFTQDLSDAVSPVVTTYLEDLVNWRVIPMVNLRLIYRFP
ncbi:hypothetical protein L3C95_22415 [Chitinophaga filiformis]|uniref:hypothetical protein n=1 Tax=Chitinophaga filiformis TaxID=104663 RepID=UPI001F2EB826|nr:hypothetical protein [Chitinophaga filiformis]MCF6405676.1 hypothetical protein [Chitinophaga filiformis]